MPTSTLREPAWIACASLVSMLSMFHCSDSSGSSVDSGPPPGTLAGLTGSSAPLSIASA